MTSPTTRRLVALHSSERDDIGDLVTRRPLPGREVEQISPFLFLNHHGPQTYPPNNRGLPFGPHPHRGFETVTFILRGDLAHHDTGGHQSVIHAGGLQWMTAGRGLVHAEVSPPSFKQNGGPLEILQLWVNLPARLKMTAPRYSGLQEGDIPAISLDDDGTLHLVAGEFAGQRGPVRSLTDVFMSIVRLPAGARVSLPAPSHRNVFLYVVEGGGSISGRPFERWQLAELGHDGDAVEISAEQPTVLLFGHADPIDEPVMARGPFVMNTPEEINEAIRDYQAGKFNGTDELLDVGA